jgi:hypothetical protein
VTIPVTRACTVDGGRKPRSASECGQELAGHTSLATTHRYIQGDSAAKRNVIKLI